MVRLSNSLSEPAIRPRLSLPALLLAAALAAGRLSAACAGFDLCSEPYLFNNDAGYPGGAGSFVINLTNGVGWQYGSAWNPDPIDLTADFDQTFQLYFGNDNNGGDGICFVLQGQGPTAMGNVGGALGIGGYSSNGVTNTAITPSVAVEFDTFLNDGSNLPNNADPAYDHINIDINGNVAHAGCDAWSVSASGSCPVQASASSADIEDGAWHTVRLIWTYPGHQLNVWFDGSLRMTYNRDIINDVFGGASCVWFGFTAASGGVTAVQRVRFPSCLPSPTPTPTFSYSPTPFPPGCGLPALEDARLIAAGCLNPGGGNHSYAYTAPSAANALMILRIETTASSTLPSAVAYNGNAFTLLSTSTGGYGSTSIHTYYQVNPSAGAHNVTFSGPTGCNWNVAVEFYSNVDTANPVGSFNASFNAQADGSGNFSLSVPSSAVASLLSTYMASEQVCNAGDVPTLGSLQSSLNLRTTGTTMACCECVFGDIKPVYGTTSQSLSYHLAQANRKYHAQPIEIRGAPCATETPTPVLSATPSRSPTPSATPAPPSPTCTATPSPSPTPSATPPALSPTQTASFSATPAPPSPTATPAPLMLTPRSPNPNPGNLETGFWLPFEISAPADVSVRVYDVSGETVRDLDPTRLAPGAHERWWDARNSAGSGVASGVYLCRIRAVGDDGTVLDVFVKAAVAR